MLPAYLSQHWASHLRRAGLRKELFAVVGDDGWYRLQLAADPTEGAFIQDLETAWAEADTEDPPSASDGTSVNVIADALRYALAMASVRSRSSNLPTAALPYLIEERSWSVRQAFAAARQYPEPEKRAEAFAVLGDTLTDARERVAAWREALDELGSVSEYQALTLFMQWPSKLPEAVFPDALDAARGYFTGEEMVTALTSLLPCLGSDQQQVVADEAAAAARRLPDTKDWEEAPRARALIQLALSAPQPLSHDFTSEALKAARSIQSARARADQLAALAPALDQATRRSVLADALAAMDEIEDDDQGPGQALEAIAKTAMDDASYADIFAAAERLARVPGPAPVLQALAPRLPKRLAGKALVMAESTGDVQCITAIAKRLVVLGQQEEARAAADRLGWRRATESVLAGIAAEVARHVDSQSALGLVRGLDDPAIGPSLSSS